MNAVNAPVRRSHPEINTGEMAMQQPAPIVMPETGLPERGEVVPQLGDTKLQDKYFKDLAFAEEPILIQIMSAGVPGEKFPAKSVHCAVNGKGAEALINGKWVPILYVPVNQPITLKRKYVEVLLRSKIDSVTTQHAEEMKEHESNLLNTQTRQTTSAVTVSILNDPNPAGRDWVTRIMWER